MAEKVSRNELEAQFNNRLMRSKLTATDTAAYSALRDQHRDARVAIDRNAAGTNKAASLGLFEDSLSFMHLFTKSVNFTVNSTRFKGKRGHQIRGGVVSITSGLAADYKPAILRADKNEDKVKFENNNTAPQIVLVDKNNDNLVNYLDVRVDREKSVLEPNNIFLRSVAPSRIPINDSAYLKFEGFELDNAQLKFIAPTVVKKDPETNKFDKEVNASYARVVGEGLDVDSEATGDTLEDIFDLKAADLQPAEGQSDTKAEGGETAAEQLSQTAEEKSLTATEGKTLSATEGEPMSATEGKTLSATEGEPMSATEGKTLSATEGEPVSATEGKTLSATEEQTPVTESAAIAPEMQQVITESTTPKGSNGAAASVDEKNIETIPAPSETPLLQSAEKESTSGPQVEQAEVTQAAVSQETQQTTEDDKKENTNFATSLAINTAATGGSILMAAITGKNPEEEGDDNPAYTYDVIKGKGKKREKEKKDPRSLEKFYQDTVDIMVAGTGNVIKESVTAKINNETLREHAENAVDTGMEVISNVAKSVAGGEAEEEDERKATDPSAEVSLADYVTAVIQGDMDSVAMKRLQYAKSLFKNFSKTGDAGFTPDDETREELQLQTSEGELQSKGLSGFELGGSINILPWLYGFGSITPTYMLKIVPDYNIKPAYELDPVKLAEAIAPDLKFGGRAKRANQAGEEGYNQRLKNEKDKEEVLDALISAVKVTVDASVSLLGKVGVDAKIGLGVGNPYLFGVEGYVGGGLNLAGEAADSKKNTLLKVGASSELSLADIGKPKEIPGKIFDNTKFEAKAGIGLTADVKAAARIRSKLLTIDYDLIKFVEASYKLAKLNYSAEITRKEGGPFFGFDFEQAFSAEALSKNIKANSGEDGNYGFSFNKKDTSLNATMEVLNQGDKKSEEVTELLELVKSFEGKDISELDTKELTATQDKLRIAAYDVEKLATASSHSADMLSNSKEFQKELTESRDELTKHQGILDKLNAWAGNKNTSKFNADALAYEKYLEINGGDKSLDKSVKEGLRDEVLPKFTTRFKLLAYERDKLAKDEKDSLALLARLEELKATCKVKDMNVVNPAYTQAYLKAAGGIICNGIKDSLSEYADPEMIRDYERRQIEAETKSHTDRIVKINEFLNKQGITDLSAPSKETADYYLKEIKASRLYNNLDQYVVTVDDIISYEESQFNTGETEKLFGSYKELMALKDQYDSAKTKKAKNSFKYKMYNKFIEAYGEDKIRDKAYRMFSADELIEYEDKQADLSLEKATSSVRNKDGSVDIGKMMKMKTSGASDVIKEYVDIEGLLRYEESHQLALQEGKSEEDVLKSKIVEYRVEKLETALSNLNDFEDEEQRDNFLKEIKNDYFSGVWDREAKRKYKTNFGKKDEVLTENVDFIKEYKTNADIRDPELDEKFILGMEDNIRNASGKSSIDLITSLREWKASGMSDVEIYQAYKNASPNDDYKENIKKEFKDKNLKTVTPEQMIRFAGYMLRSNSRDSYGEQFKKSFGNSFPGGRGRSKEVMQRAEKEGHFGRWERLVALRDSEEFAALSPEAQRAKLTAYYKDVLVGGGGLNDFLKKNYVEFMTPMAILNYEKDRMGEKSLRRRKRLETLDGKVAGDDLSDYKELASSDGAGFSETFKWLWKKMSGNYTIDFDKQADADKILTPANIVDYEKRKMASNSRKHRERVDMLQAAKGKKASEIYQEYVKMGGGNGFLRAHAEEIKKAEAATLKKKYRGGNYDLETIRKFEQGKIDENAAKYNNTVALSDRISKQYDDLIKLYNEIQEKIKAIERLKASRLSAGKGTK